MLEADDYEPLDPAAQGFLQQGDSAVAEADGLAAAAYYARGLEIEPGNSKLKQRNEAIRRYLAQRQELEKLVRCFLAHCVSCFAKNYERSNVHIPSSRLAELSCAREMIDV